MFTAILWLYFILPLPESRCQRSFLVVSSCTSSLAAGLWTRTLHDIHCTRRGQEHDWMTFGGSFQLRLFYDSVTMDSQVSITFISRSLSCEQCCSLQDPLHYRACSAHRDTADWHSWGWTHCSNNSRSLQPKHSSNTVFHGLKDIRTEVIAMVMKSIMSHQRWPALLVTTCRLSHISWNCT